ncbi:flagellar hook-associated protein FlgL [Sphingomicrobium astaxanthinifaciens]|uniref:flagellar hook-associated protein FlgL n=1 Tax=Sphingomicrobium astaxanthinifaciens TaxID=1227949 RepID=UPI001FCBA134|nr:flagellar hook-associated protein FlgL [Sphingomicrobium astaxanthinifaciens]MCJ7420373.1 flagellar hook-associated protein FlgL [Sphingomicrobium astaxanthinifaciens]
MINLSTNDFYARATGQLAKLRESAEKLQGQIATGERIERSSDDPVGAAQLRSLDRQKRLAGVDQRNADLVASDLQLADDALGEMANLVIRARELAVSAANGTASEQDRLIIAVELESLRESLLTVANSRDTAGHALFGGTTTGMAFEKVGNVVSYSGTQTSSEVEISPDVNVSRGIVGQNIVQFSHAGSATDLFAVIENLVAQIRADPAAAAAGARDATEAFGAALEKVTVAQTDVGAKLGLIGVVGEQRQSTLNSIAERENQVGGVDLATAVSNLQSLMTVLEASQASFVRLSSLTLFNRLR